MIHRIYLKFDNSETYPACLGVDNTSEFFWMNPAGSGVPNPTSTAWRLPENWYPIVLDEESP
jgi:hypothetical protein